MIALCLLVSVITSVLTTLAVTYWRDRPSNDRRDDDDNNETETGV